MAYIRFPIESNPHILVQDAYNYIKTRSPAWREYDGNLDTWILQSVAQQASDLRVLASDVPDSIFLYFGSTILGIPPNPATKAYATTTWTAIDLLGHLIPAGTIVGVRDAGGTLRGFETVLDYSILAGLDSTDEGEVIIRALDAGIASTNLGIDGSEVEPVDNLDFIRSITLEETTTGGADAETVEDYMARLAEYMRGLSTRPILAEDYARLAMNQPSIYRAVAIDGYNPDNDTYFNDKIVTIAAVDQFGLDLPTEVKDDLDTFMESQREVNFIVNVIDASRTTVDVTFEATALPTFDPALVEANAIAAVTGYLSPANWGLDPTIRASDASRTWVETQFVYYNNIIAVIENVNGVDHVTTLLIARNGDSPDTDDVVLDVPAALTEPGVIDGTVLGG